MLDATTSASDSDSETPVAAPVSPVGPRSGRKKKRGLLHRTGVVVPALGMAILLVVGVLVGAKMLNTSGSGASGLFQSIDSLGQSKQVSALESVVARREFPVTRLPVARRERDDRGTRRRERLARRRRGRRGRGRDRR